MALGWVWEFAGAGLLAYAATQNTWINFVYTAWLPDAFGLSTIVVAQVLLALSVIHK